MPTATPAPEPQVHRAVARSSDSIHGNLKDGLAAFLTASFAKTAESQKTVTLQIGALLILLCVVPREMSIEATVFGVKITSIAFARDVVVLGATMLLAHLTALMAEGARLSMALGARFALALSDDEKKLASMAVGDSTPEVSLFERRESVGKRLYPLYYIARATEGLLYYFLLIALVGGLGYTALQTIILSWRHPALPSPAWQLVLGLTILFGVQAVLGLLQYWLVRRLPTR